jgi:hypothetical protein
MGTINISVYVKTDDLGIYSENSELLNQKAREAFEKELSRIKECLSKAIPVGQASIILEDTSDDKVHEEVARINHKRATDRLFKVKERHEKGLKGKGGM